MSEQIQWCVLVTLPDGAPDVEKCSSRSGAVLAANAIDRITPGARLVYRTVKYGPWDSGTVGGEWGVQHIWSDGHAEVQAHASRHQAEASSRSPLGDQTRIVVSRTVNVSDWWLAEVTA